MYGVSIITMNGIKILGGNTRKEKNGKKSDYVGRPNWHIRCRLRESIG
jgi:hypothetical protein